MTVPFVIVEYSSDEQATWTEIYNYKTQDDAEAPSTSTRYYHKEMSFTAPAEGTYYLRFTSTYQNGVDNFAGFKLALPDHKLVIASSSIPASGSQYVDYTATATVTENAGKDEEAVATLYVAGEAVATETLTISANGSATFTLTFTPEEALEEAEAYIKVEYAEENSVQTETTSLTIAAAPVLDEESGDLAGFENWASYPVVVLKYSLKAGWNTIVLPFAVKDLSVFGADAEAYKLSSYADGTLHFSLVTELEAQTPYVLYASEAKDELLFRDVTMFRTSAEAEDLYARNVQGIKFQGTYAPVAAPNMEGKYGVTGDGHIAKGSATASIKGFRAYFELTDEQAAGIKELSFDGGNATGIKGIENGQMLDGQVFNLAGQRVQKMQRGINIVNGKKVIRK